MHSTGPDPVLVAFLIISAIILFAFIINLAQGEKTEDKGEK